MKGVVAVLALIVGVSVAASGAGSIRNMDLAKDLHQVSIPDAGSFESKLANALKDVHPAKGLISQYGNIEGNSNNTNQDLSARQGNLNSLYQSQNSRALSNASSPIGTLVNGNSTNGPIANGTSTNETLDNRTSMNRTAINQSSLNSSALGSSVDYPALRSSPSSISTVGAGGMATISDDASVSTNAIGAEDKGTFNGFWIMDANKGGIGKAKIKSHTYLSGGFNVDKTVKFSDR
jgi:hypothetical protein